MFCIKLKEPKLALESIFQTLNPGYIQIHQLTFERSNDQSPENQLAVFLSPDNGGTKFLLTSFDQQAQTRIVQLSLKYNEKLAIVKEGHGTVNLFMTILDSNGQLIVQPESNPVEQTTPEVSPPQKVKKSNPIGQTDIESVLGCLKSSAEKIQGKIEKHFPGRRMNLTQFVISKKSKKFKKK